MTLSNPPAERAVLAGLIQHGENAYLEVCDFLTVNSFTIDSNQLLYKCLKHIFEQPHTVTVDVASIYAAANELKLEHFLNRTDEVKHLQAIRSLAVSIDNTKVFAKKISKLEVARVLSQQLEYAKQNLHKITGDESIANILGIAEDTIFNFNSHLHDNEGFKTIGEDIDEYIQHLIDNPVENVGIVTQYAAYNEAIGGGCRPGTVNVIAARPKTGKTLLADNIGLYVAGCGIPVLNLDTEMQRQDHQNRSLGILSEVDITKIERGVFGRDEKSLTKVLKAGKEIKNRKYFHEKIPGMPFAEQMALLRRWLYKEVGLNTDGTAKDCLIIYDYLKLMDTSEVSDMQEYQALGFRMTELHNFAVKYNVPVLAFIQLNRDGITKETTDTASGSDRIIWLCSNFTIFKKKSDEEIAEDGVKAGNRKLVPVVARHGAWDDRNYINLTMTGSCGLITEGKTKFELEHQDDDEYDVSEQFGKDIPFN